MEKSHSQTNLKIRYCNEHWERRIEGFCEYCKEFFCEECAEDHIGHKATRLEDFCRERKKNVLSQISVEEVPVQLERKRREVNKEGKKLKEDREDAKRVSNVKKKAIKNKEEKLEQEFEHLEGVTRYLTGLEEEASTVTLKDACKRAIEVFDIKDKIREEFETLEDSLEDMKKKMKEMNKKMRELKEEIELLKYLRGDDGKYEFDDDKWITLLMLNEKTPLFKPSKVHVDMTVNSFRAFPSVERIFDIEEVMKQKLVDVGQGVRMTKPLKVEKNLLTGNHIYVSLSHQGVLAIYANNKTIQFTNLNTNGQVRMKVEFDSLVGFYDGMVLLLTYYTPLREAKIESVFNNPIVETFEIIEETSYITPYTDVSLLNERRELLYRTRDGKLFSFNVDTKKNTEINLGIGVSTIASFTGIDCNVRAVFKSSDKCTYTLDMDNTLVKVNGKQNDGLIALFPSGSDPKDISNAVFKYGLKLMKGKNEISTGSLVKFNDWYSVVRIYRDIFLAYDVNVKSWVLVRLITP